MMTTATSPLLTRAGGSVVSDVIYRAWGSALHSVLEGCGLTVVSTTVDWTTITWPVADDTYNAETVYRFDDGLTEVYLKVEWGRYQPGSRGDYLLRYTVTIGSTTKTITAPDDAFAAGEMGAAWYASFIDGALMFTCVSQSVATTRLNTLVVIERSRDSSGDPDSRGVLVGVGGPGVSPSAWSGDSGITFYQLMVAPSSVSACTPVAARFVDSVVMDNNIDWAVPRALWTLPDGTVTAARSLVTVRRTTIGALSQFTITDGSDTRTYRTPSYTATTNNYAPAGQRLAYRWD